MGGFLAVGVSRLQGRLERPLVDIRAIVRNHALSAALLVQLLLYMSAYCTIFMLSIYMQISLGHAAKTSGQIIAIGSGGPYAQAAARALLKHTKLKPTEIVKEALTEAAKICIYTNTNIVIEELK